MSTHSGNSDDYYSRKRVRDRNIFIGEDVALLIETVKASTVLWDTSDPKYSVRALRQKAWATIASSIFHDKFDVNQLQTKWDTLRIQFRHHYRKSLKSKNGKPPYWHFYSKLLFLLGAPKRGTSRAPQPIIKTEEEATPTLPTYEEPEPDLITIHTPEISDDQPSSHSNQDFFEPLLEPPHFTRNYDEREREGDIYIADVQDSFQMFGNYVASELRQIRNVREAKRVQRKLTYKLLECLDALDDATSANFE